jgi:hypothetical protein
VLTTGSSGAFVVSHTWTHIHDKPDAMKIVIVHLFLSLPIRERRLYFFPFPLALNVFRGSTLPFLLITFLPLPFTYLFLSTLGTLRPTKPTSAGFLLPPGSR